MRSANLAMTLPCEVQPSKQFCRVGACGEGGAQRAMQPKAVAGSRHTGSRLAQGLMPAALLYMLHK